ncbi:MAG: DUF3304 domain-containing protein [Pseudomonadota bacterium]
MSQLFSPRYLARFLLLGVLALGACQKPAADVEVNIHGVNYAGDAFSYYVIDPAKPKSGAGGELINAFEAGGMTCCFTLPKVWRPGIKVRIDTTHWLPKRPDNSLPEVKETHLVEVPRYADGKPGELWVLRAEDGRMSVVSSDFQPDHEKWPGKVKGWPVPSLEYRRQRWEIYRNHEEGGVRLFLSLLEELEKDPQRQARDAWEFAKQYEPDSLTKFSGPDDPQYRMMLKKDYMEGLQMSRERLKNVMEAQP